MIVIIILAAALAIGTLGVGAMVCAGIASEDRDRSLAGRPASRSEALTRRIVGWHGEPPRIVSAADRQAECRDARPHGRPSLTVVSGR
jgi:hypothetical protein